MTRVLDPEGAHLAALRRLADFRGQRVLELGCGDGRLTVPVAMQAAFALAFDPDEEAVARAGRSLPAALDGCVEYRVAAGTEIERDIACESQSITTIRAGSLTFAYTQRVSPSNTAQRGRPGRPTVATHVPVSGSTSRAS